MKLGAVDLMAYYYAGQGVGTTGLFVLSDDGSGHARDSDGFIAQATCTFGRTKLGINYGQSNLERASAEAPSARVSKNSKYTLGVYRSLTANLTLVSEFSDVRARAHNGFRNDSSSVNVGAFMTF